MELEISHGDGYVLATTAGAIDDSAAGRFRESLHPLVGQSGTKVVLDLSRSSFINSRGIALLESLVNHANVNGSRVILAACSPFVAEVLIRCKLDRFFEMADGVSDAIRLLLG
jgi:anti-sigma B factor antagonist